MYPESPYSLLLYMEMSVWIKPPPKWTIVSTGPHKRQEYPIKSDLVKSNKKAMSRKALQNFSKSC